MDPQILRSIWPIFSAETREQIQAIGTKILGLEDAPAGRDPDLLPSLRRLVHSLKGSAASLGLSEIEQVVHAIEDGLARFRWDEQLPGAPRHVMGALVSRSRVVPVLDLRQLLGLEGGGMSDLGKVVVVDVAGDAFGIAAEQVDGRQELLRSTLSQAPAGPFLHLTPDRLTVLDLAQLGAPSTERQG